MYIKKENCFAMYFIYVIRLYINALRSFYIIEKNTFFFFIYICVD